MSGGEVANKLRYTGREFDRETGLYYYRARYYDPELGRFYTEDPLGFRAGINFYAYVSNNPLIYRDPTGLFNFIAGAGASAVTGTGGEGSVGGVYNLETGREGLFSSVGIGTGINASWDVFGGFILGDFENVSGTSVNQNIVFGPFSITVMSSMTTNEFLGMTFGFGLPSIQGSSSISHTEVIETTAGKINHQLNQDHMIENYFDKPNNSSPESSIWDDIKSWWGGPDLSELEESIEPEANTETHVDSSCWIFCE